MQPSAFVIILAVGCLLLGGCRTPLEVTEFGADLNDSFV